MVVLDTSVVIKWFVEEPDSKAALAFRDEHLAGQELIVVPTLFFYEFTNVLRYVKSLPEESIISILGDLEQLGRREESSHDVIAEAVIFARKFEISVYDGVFVALAYLYGVELITADAKLVDKTKSLRFVKLL